MFIITFLFLVFLTLVILMGTRYPILYLLNTIVTLLTAATDFSAKGNDWANTLWGSILLGVAWYWGSQYLKYRHKKL